MLVYHGSNVVVDKPRIITPNRYLDFGAGFYTTSNRAQAINFADKVTQRRNSGRSSISVYELDERAFGVLNTLRFNSANEIWLDFVSDNRMGAPMKERYDLIIGPVANDDVYQTIILYASGVLTKEQTLLALKIRELYDQYVFTTAKALAYLKLVDVVYGTEARSG